jgi:hypothetical protein
MFNSTIHQHQQIDLTRNRLGRISAMSDGPTEPATTGLRFRSSQPVEAPTVTFPLGCRTRIIDASNRVKWSFGEMAPSTLLGWENGLLDAVVIDGWLTLQQRPSQVGASRRRNSAYAGFGLGTNAERISLRHGHLAGLGLDAGDDVLVAVIPDRQAVVMCDPNRIAAVAPAPVVRMLRPVGVDIADVTDIASARSTVRQAGEQR